MEEYEFYYLFGKELLAEETALIFCQESFEYKDRVKSYHNMIYTFMRFKNIFDDKKYTLSAYSEKDFERFYEIACRSNYENARQYFKSILEQDDSNRFDETVISQISNKLKQVYEEYTGQKDNYGWGAAYIEMLKELRNMEESLF